MAVMQLVLSSFNMTDPTSFYSDIPGHLPELLPTFDWFCNLWLKVAKYVEQPHVYKPLTAFWIALIVIYIILSSLGFSPAGIVVGSLMAAFQSWAYGGFTPAGGLFATLTSIAMLGLAQPVFFVIAFIIASLIAFIVSACLD